MPPTLTHHQGAVLTTTRQSDMHQESWSSKLHRQIPFGKFPLVASLDQMGAEMVPSRFHHWANEAFDGLFGTVLDVYTNAGLSSAYVSGGAVDGVYYVAVTANDANRIIGNDMVLFTNPDNSVRLLADVLTTNIAGDSTSYFVIRLREADSSAVLAKSNLTWVISGHAEAEMSELPTAISSEPEWYDNNTQIFMESLEMSGTEEQEIERLTETKRARDKRNALVRMKMKEERAFFFGKKGTRLVNGKQKRYMDGIHSALKTRLASHIVDFRTDTHATANAKTWAQGGLDWLEHISEEASIYSEAGVKRIYAGSKAWLGINSAVKGAGTFELKTRQNAFGIRITTLVGLTQEWEIVLHPLFSVTPGFQYSAFVSEPGALKKRTMRNRGLKFIPRGTMMDGHTWIDGFKEGWMEECTLEYTNLDSMFWLDGIGLNNSN